MASQEFSMAESLESRTLLAANASLFGEILVVRGDLLSKNTIVVGNSADGLSVNVSITSLTRRGVTKTFTASFLKSLGISKVAIAGGIKDDSITIDQTNSPFSVATYIHAGPGDDTVTAGDEKDTIGGGLGNDNITAGAGDDLVCGGIGNDTLLGGDGNDTLWGGPGKDSIDGGNGDDTLGGVIGRNTLIGGAGKDTFVVRNLNANPTNDYNSAEDVLNTTGRITDLQEPPA